MSRPESDQEERARFVRPIVPMLMALAGAADPARAVILNPLFAGGIMALDVRRCGGVDLDIAEDALPAKQRSQPNRDCLAQDNVPRRHRRVIILLDKLLIRSPV
jgi:hypothetical protein